MDHNTKKILIFLRKNPSLHLGPSNIAYHLHLNEVFVTQALNTLHRNSLVEARLDADGTTGWHSVDMGQKDRKDNVLSKVSIDENRLDSLAQGSGFPLMKVAVVLFLISAVVMGGIYGYGFVERRIKMETLLLLKTVVPLSEYEAFKEKSVKILDKLEIELKMLHGQIDSLQTSITLLEEKTDKTVAIRKKRR